MHSFKIIQLIGLQIRYNYTEHSAFLHFSKYILENDASL